MIILHDVVDIPVFHYAVVTTGTFDGVHAGHRKILTQLTNSAKANNGESIVITYWPHPRFILSEHAADLKLLNTFEEKATLLSACGVDYLIKIPFNRSFSELSSQMFIQHYLLDKIKTRRLIIGYDHRFGKDREGGFDYLMANQSKFGFEIEEISKQNIDDVAVSSTKIRQALQEGNMLAAAHYLTMHYRLSGIVTKGDQLGRQIGFPTANLFVAEDYKLIPSNGVYAVWVHLDGIKHQGMLNIGTRPTVDGTRQTIEVHIFEFSADIYGRTLTVEFVDLLRREKKFDSLADLRAALELDKLKAIEILNK